MVQTMLTGAMLSPLVKLELTVTTGTTAQVTGTFNWLYVNNASTVAALAIGLPSAPVDGQFVLVSTRSAITTLTYSNGTVNGGPSTLAAGKGLLLAWSGITSAWFPVL